METVEFRWLFRKAPAVQPSPTSERWQWVLVGVARDGREIRLVPPGQPLLSFAPGR